ncbi:MAG: nicotinate phosphoribosyltransferase [Burkholderiales bacterium]
MRTFDPLSSPLLTDLYQLTMLQGYFVSGMNGVASFELFVRRMPRDRAFLVAAGLESVLEYLENLRFGEPELGWLKRCGLFRSDFIDWLGALRFDGMVEAMEEGTIFFANEPILRITAPISQAQLIESRIVNIMHFQSLLASKAARSVLAAPKKRLIEFGMRRAHGAEAALFAARAAYLVGFQGTSVALAEATYGIPAFGTMGHSFVQAHHDEAAAFLAFARTFPQNAILLIDTYDTELAAHKVVEVAQTLAQEGITIRGVRLDSGDLLALSRSVRAILDAGGLSGAIIFASGNLDEHRIAALERDAAPIDAYGIGTALVTSADAPSLDMVYKLQELDGAAKRKRSPGKATWPGRKQVFRFFDSHGRFAHDEVTLMSDHRHGEPLLRPVMRDGRRLRPMIPLESNRAFAMQSLEQLPANLRELNVEYQLYHVAIGQSVRDLADAVDQGMMA